ncbi:unnamed protein product [Prorocentrum cordatum]|uniref:Uncharacterized protein n=1 Tax=Prorocentrum cordatum TaxID=2364126 RepID=A0ABN9SS41_9DINO|nr:unnamed protein product [Polarella glacialis]
MDPSALLLDALRALCGTGPGQAGVVQAMAFGNYDATSGTGWALLRARRASGEGLRGGWRPRVGSYAVAAGPDGGPLGAAVEGELSRRAEGLAWGALAVMWYHGSSIEGWSGTRSSPAYKRARSDAADPAPTVRR